MYYCCFVQDERKIRKNGESDSSVCKEERVVLFEQLYHHVRLWASQLSRSNFPEEGLYVGERGSPLQEHHCGVPSLDGVQLQGKDSCGTCEEHMAGIRQFHVHRLRKREVGDGEAEALPSHLGPDG